MNVILRVSIYILIATLPFQLSAQDKTHTSKIWINRFESLGKQVKDLNTGTVAFSLLSQKLFSSHFYASNIEHAYQNASGIIEKIGSSSEVKREMQLFLCHLSSTDLGNAVRIDEIEDLDLPGSLVLGCVEILVGSLVHVVPGCSWLGKMIIADGVRRTFNGLEEIDTFNKTE